MSIMPAVARTLSHVYPADARLTDDGRLEIAGCDVIKLAREFGTPAYVYAENDMRAKARVRGGVPLAHRALRGDLRVQGVSGDRHVQAVRRGRPVDRLRVRRRV